MAVTLDNYLTHAYGLKARKPEERLIGSTPPARLRMQYLCQRSEPAVLA